MQLASCAHVSSGIVSNNAFAARSTGETVVMPNPLYLLEHSMAAIPQQTLTTDSQITIDLSTWSLYDLENNRPIGLVLTGEPGTDFMSRVATRYAREARDLPEHELTEWASRVVEQMQVGDAA